MRARPAGTALSVPTADEDARLRALIRAELDRQHALPLARRTLELLAEAAAEPASGAPGYRVVDRNGRTRLRPVEAETPAKDKAKKPRKGEAAPAAPSVPMSLSDLVGELRARHPALFGTPPPEPEPPPPAPEHRAGVGETVAHVRAAGARFVGTQTALARSLAARSAERGRAFAAVAGETVGGWRRQLDERRTTHRAAMPESGGVADAALPARFPTSPEGAATPPAQAATPATMAGQAGAMPPRRDWRAFGRDAVVRLRSGGEGFRARLRRNPDAAPASGPALREVADGLLRRRLTAAGLGGAGVIALVIVAVVLVRPKTDGAPPQENPLRQENPPRQETAPQEKFPQQAEAAPQTPPPAAQDSAPPPQAAPGQPPADPEEQPDEQPQRGNPNDIVGVPEVIDTATLRVSGKLVHLFGVEWVRGGQAEELAKYLAGRSITCQPAPGSGAHLCSVNGRDLSEVVLFNGGGRASSEATPDLVAAEDRARSERLGVWKR